MLPSFFPPFRTLFEKRDSLNKKQRLSFLLLLKVRDISA